MYKRYDDNKNHGFTLIELLVVIAIIGMLSSVVLASLNTAREKSRDARRISDFRQLKTALELYYNDNRGYPVCAGLYIEDQNNCLATALTPKYISNLPVDPRSGGDGNSQWGYDYQYYQTTDQYALRVILEGTSFPRTGSYPNGNTCQSAEYPTCSWYGDCVYAFGAGCSGLMLQAGVRK
tara:strand:+ start:2777 stop:3316 length:540 start_codon:yes stop_codon:yes gene_type:complete